MQFPFLCSKVPFCRRSGVKVVYTLLWHAQNYPFEFIQVARHLKKSKHKLIFIFFVEFCKISILFVFVYLKKRKKTVLFKVSNTVIMFYG